VKRLFPIAIALVAAAAPAPAHALTIHQQQCFYMRSSDAGCTRSNGMQSANDVVVSPDGRNVYAVSGFEDYGALLSFRRDPKTGKLTQLPGKRGCISNDGRNAQAGLDPKHGIGLKGRCASGGPMPEATQVAISPDGRTIYVLAMGSFRQDGDALTLWRRDPRTGYVHELQCWTRLGTRSCPKAPYDEPVTMLLSAFDHRLFIGGANLTAFVAADDGRLYAPSVISSRPFSALATAPAGETIFGASGNEVDAFDTDGTMRASAPVDDPRDIAVAPDGNGVYVAAANLEQREGARDVLRSSSVSSFAAPLTPAGCAVYEGRDRNPGCSTGPALYEAESVAITPDGGHAIAAFVDSAALLVLDRDRATQALTPVAGRGGCVRAPHQWVDFKTTAPCNRGHGMYAPLAVAISSDGRNAYLAGGDGLAVFRLA
jgi:DNA-binding beta-propeller fold protein YncE